jgi:hypothetical protein
MLNFALPHKNIAPLPGIASPKLAAKIRNAVRSQQINQDWRNWETWNSAIASSSSTQNLAWNSFEQYRLLINNHKTFDHMRVWEAALNTGEESRYLWDIAGKDTLILAPRESAKAQPLTELVLTPDGWRCMGELKVGDEVIAGDGTFTRITKITPQGIKPSYRVSFTDGASTECSDDHLWAVRNLAGSNPGEFKTISLNQIRTKVFVSAKTLTTKSVRITEITYRDATPEEKPWLDYRGYSKFFIPIVQPIQFYSKSLGIHPYLMGVLIGDGSLKGQCIPAFSTGDQEIIQLVEQCLPIGYSVKQKGSGNNYSITKTVVKGHPLENILTSQLRKVGLFERGSVDKFIPKDYLFSSVSDRIALLQGLMDTDGTVATNSKGGGNISYCTISTQLVEDVVDLVRSLGGIATVQKPQRNWYTHNGEKRQGQVSYKIGIKLPENIQPFRLKRKALLYTPCTQYKPTRGITNIEYVGDTEMQCITVAHPSGLYITKNYIVTHNSTYLAQWVSYQFGMHTSPWRRLALKCLGVSYNIDTAMPRSRQIQSIMESSKYQEIFPWVRPSKKKWGEKEWMIDLEWAGLATTEEQYSYVCAGLTGAINSRRCLLGNTKIETRWNGKIPIASIRVGMEVLTFNDARFEMEWKLVKAIASQPATEILHIETIYGCTLSCTFDHLIKSTQGYIEAENLKLGDRLVGYYRENDYSDFPFTSVIDTVKLITSSRRNCLVYDIEVEDNHNFFANNILCHNCHLVLLDDLIKSPEAIRAQSVRGAMVSNWENVIQFTRYDGSRAVCLGTRMTADDIYCTTFLKEKGWNVIEQSALLEHPDGTEYSFWEPEDDKAPGIPLRRLQEERETTPIAFAFQRQNKIVRVKEQSLSPDLIVRGILPTQFSHLVLGVDLSAGLKESNDYTAFVLGGVLIEGEVFSYWIIDAWEDRIMGNTPKLDAMIEVWDSWKHLLPQTRRYNPASGDWDLSPVLGLELWFDSSAYGLSLQGDYEDHIIKRNHILDWHVKPVPASGRGGKLERLRRHTGLFHNRLIKFNMYGRTMADGRKPLGRLIQQITEFGSTSHDDLCDAFELCVSGMRSHLPLTKGNY